MHAEFAGPGQPFWRDSTSIALIVQRFFYFARQGGGCAIVVNALAAGPLFEDPALRLYPLCCPALSPSASLRWNEAPGSAPVFRNHQRGDTMSKLLSILVAVMFAVSTGSVFAMKHAAAAGEKKEEMKKEVKKDDKKAEKKAEKKEKAAKKEVKKEEKK
jgi:hypothetical protein